MGKNKHRQASTPESKKQAAVWCAIAIIAITVMVLVANPWKQQTSATSTPQSSQSAQTRSHKQNKKRRRRNRPAPCNSRHNPCSSATRNRSPTTCATC